jgi:hypothetical protein
MLANQLFVIPFALGGLPSPDPTPKDALQTHCRSPEQDGTCLSPALSPAVSWQHSTQAYCVLLVWFLGPFAKSTGSIFKPHLPWRDPFTLAVDARDRPSPQVEQ